MWVDPFSLQLESPLETAAGPITDRRGFLVGVEQDGSHGLGEATPLPGWTESYEACRTALTDAASIDTLSGIMTPDPTKTPAAAHAVNLANADAQARRECRPLAALLRETVFDTDPLPKSVPVNATIGNGSVNETVQAATDAVDKGFECLKLKVGVQKPEMDITRVQAVRETVDDNVRIRLDANEAWNRKTARDVVDQLTGTEIEYLEQPLPAADLDGLADLRGHGVDIAVDESLAKQSVDTVIEDSAADVVVIKPMAVGGPRPAIKTAAIARSAGVEPVVTTTVDGVVARTAAVHIAAAIPDVTACGLATGSLLATDLAPDPVSITGGRAHLPTGHGLWGDAFEELRRSD